MPGELQITLLLLDNYSNLLWPIDAKELQKIYQQKGKEYPEDTKE
tara:strand:+ start:1050 stop:1184 length:135 start_codon:yes stop_codon:yes gene_type:complete